VSGHTERDLDREAVRAHRQQAARTRVRACIDCGERTRNEKRCRDCDIAYLIAQSSCEHCGAWEMHDENALDFLGWLTQHAEDCPKREATLAAQAVLLETRRLRDEAEAQAHASRVEARRAARLKREAGQAAQGVLPGLEPGKRPP